MGKNKKAWCGSLWPHSWRGEVLRTLLGTVLSQMRWWLGVPWTEEVLCYSYLRLLSDCQQANLGLQVRWIFFSDIYGMKWKAVLFLPYLLPQRLICLFIQNLLTFLRTCISSGCALEHVYYAFCLAVYFSQWYFQRFIYSGIKTTSIIWLSGFTCGWKTILLKHFTWIINLHWHPSDYIIHFHVRFIFNILRFSKASA